MLANTLNELVRQAERERNPPNDDVQTVSDSEPEREDERDEEDDQEYKGGDEEDKDDDSRRYDDLDQEYEGGDEEDDGRDEEERDGEEERENELEYLEEALSHKVGHEEFEDWAIRVTEQVPTLNQIKKQRRRMERYRSGLDKATGNAERYMISQNGCPRHAGTMAQMFFAPYHTDPAVLTTQRYTPSLLCTKGYDGSSINHAASDLYLYKVDDSELLKSKNLPKYPNCNMGLRWRDGLDRTPSTVTKLQKDVFQIGLDLFETDMFKRSKFPSFTTLEGSYLRETFYAFEWAEDLYWTTMRVQGIRMPVLFQYDSQKCMVLGVFCFVKHGSYAKYNIGGSAKAMAAEGAAMDVAKNILLTLSSTANRAPRLYQIEGHRTRAQAGAKDQGHRTLCLLRAKELSDGNDLVWNDLSSDMQHYITQGGYLPDAAATGDLRTSDKSKTTIGSWLGNVLALIQKGIRSRRTPAQEEQRAQRYIETWNRKSATLKAKETAKRTASWHANPLNKIKAAAGHRPHLAKCAAERAAKTKRDHARGENLLRVHMYSVGEQWKLEREPLDLERSTSTGQVMSALQYQALANNALYSPSGNPLELWYCRETDLVFLKPTPRQQGVLQWNNIHIIKCTMCGRNMKEMDWACRPIEGFNVANKSGHMLFDSTRPTLVIENCERKTAAPS